MTANTLGSLFSKASSKHTASIIFLHGSGDTGQGVKTWLEAIVGSRPFTFPQIKVIYPTASLRAYTAHAGELNRAWFNRIQISPQAPEEVGDINSTCDELEALVQNEVKLGIPLNRIVIGGFSQGGAMACYYAYTRQARLAGVFMMSSFLPDQSIVYKALASTQGTLPPLLQTHGEHDTLVWPSWGLATHARLQQLGVNCSYTTYPICHDMSEPELVQLQQWLVERLPQTCST